MGPLGNSICLGRRFPRDLISQVCYAESYFHLTPLPLFLPLSLWFDLLPPLASESWRSTLFLFCPFFPPLSRSLFVSSCCETDGFGLWGSRGGHTNRWMCRLEVLRGPNLAAPQRPIASSFPSPTNSLVWFSSLTCFCRLSSSSFRFCLVFCPVLSIPSFFLLRLQLSRNRWSDVCRL